MNRVDAASQVAPVLVAVLDATEPVAKATGFVTPARTRPVKPPGTSTYSSFRPSVSKPFAARWHA